MNIGKLSQIGGSEEPMRGNEEDLIEAIMQNDERSIASLYRVNFEKVKRMVWAFRNVSIDPEDIYQEGFSLAIYNVREGKFRAESSFSTYLISICRNLCLKQLSRNGTVELTEKYEVIEETKDHDLLNSIIKFKHQLGDKCREVIDLRFTLGDAINSDAPNKCMSFEEIAYRLEITSVSARQRFKRCLDKLKELIMASSELKTYFSS
ncbi:MAG: RNA polymerase sigma factor [Chitinophagaceae bacterium]|jgi:RNA polymerase sigma factor (sigma-70 family)